MAFTKPNVNRVWAATGTSIAPTNSKIDQGWVVEIPDFEFENFIQNRQDQFNAHVNQYGIPVWDAATEYQANKSYVQGSDGFVYKALTTNTNQNPVTQPTHWVRAFDEFDSSYDKATADSRFLNSASDLSDLNSTSIARTNLQVYSKTESDARYLDEANNLSDLDDAPTARTNLGVYGTTEVYNKTESDDRYVNATGDTMTGALTLSGDPTQELHAAPKQYVDFSIGQRVIYVDTVANLKALTLPEDTVVYLSEDGRSGEFISKVGIAPTDTQEGIYINLNGGGYVERVKKNPLKASWFGATGLDIAEDTAAIQAIESTTYNDIDLGGLVLNTTLIRSDLSKRYVNGQLFYTSQRGDQVIYENNFSEDSYALDRLSTKTPVINWEGREVLWLGTSIPHFGDGSGDSYPNIFSKYFGCNVNNQAWSGSHAGYDVDGDPFSIDTIKALSMTEDDRQAGLSEHGTSSAYDDSFDLVTKASQQTANARIKSVFENTPFSVVFLDHNHNDRFRGEGVLNPTPVTITSITKGVQTTVTLSSQIFQVGDGVGLRVVGIDDLDYLAARVQSVSGNDITLNIDSSSMAGTFTSGDARNFDRSTVYGAWEFLIYYIRNSALINGVSGVNIILSSAPSKYTNDADDGGVYSNAKFLKNIANEYGLAFFDVAESYEVSKDQHLALFPDGVHPSTLNSRKALSAYWINWAAGGLTQPISQDDFLPSTRVGGVYKSRREPIYNAVVGGFETPDVIFTDPSAIDNFTFSTGLTGWTTTGTTATAVSDPDGSADTSIKFDYTPTNAVYISRALSSTTAHPEVVLNIWLDSVTGLTSEQTGRIITVLRLRQAGGSSYAIQLVVKPESVKTRVVYFDSPGSGQNILTGSSNDIIAGQDNTIRLTVFKVTAENSLGRIIASVNDVEILNEAAETGSLGQVSDIDAGFVFSNLDQATSLYVNRIGVFGRSADDYRNRFTGNFTAQGGETVTVVNGIITSVV